MAGFGCGVSRVVGRACVVAGYKGHVSMAKDKSAVHIAILDHDRDLEGRRTLCGYPAEEVSLGRLARITGKDEKVTPERVTCEQCRTLNDGGFDGVRTSRNERRRRLTGPRKIHWDGPNVNRTGRFACKIAAALKTPCSKHVAEVTCEKCKEAAEKHHGIGSGMASHPSS